MAERGNDSGRDGLRPQHAHDLYKVAADDGANVVERARLRARVHLRDLEFDVDDVDAERRAVDEAVQRLAAAAHVLSARLRAVMSRAILDAPTMRPLSSMIGETASEMSSSEPSLRRRTVS